VSRRTPTNVVGGVYNSVAPVFTDGQFVALQFDINGNLLTTGGGGGGGNASVSLVGNSVPTSATAIGMEDGSGNLQFVSAANPLPITGSISATNPSVGVIGSAIPSDATLLGVKDGSGNLQAVSAAFPVRVDPTGTTTQPVSFLALPAGSNLIGQVEVSDGTNVLFTSGHPGFVAQGTAAALTAGWPIVQGQTTEVAVLWTSSTTVNTASAISVVGYSSVVVALYPQIASNNCIVTFEASDTTGGSPIWYQISGLIQNSGTSSINAMYVLTSASNPTSVTFDVSAWNQFRVRLSTTTLPSGSTVGVGITASAGAITPIVGIAASGILQVAPTTTANSKTNSFFTEISDGSNTVTTNSTATSGKYGLDTNLLSILGTAPTTAGFLDIKGADGNVFVRQTTAANLNATVVGTGTFLVQAAQATAASLNATVVGTGTLAVQNTAATPAGTNLIGQVSASDETSTVYNGVTALTPLFAVIVASNSGVTNVVAATSGKKIRVLRWSLTAAAAVNFKWQSHVTPTDLTGLYYTGITGGISEAYCPVGHFQTISGEALDINLSGSVAVGGSLTYVLV